jgi:hypothetical protein
MSSSDAKYFDVSIWLRNTYGTISDGPLYLESDLTETMEPSLNKHPSQIWFSGNEIYKYIWHTLQSGNDNRPNNNNCNDVVTIFVPGLRNVYWNHRKYLDADRLASLSAIIKNSRPLFIPPELYGPDNYELFGITNTIDISDLGTEISRDEASMIEGYIRSARVMLEINTRDTTPKKLKDTSIYKLEKYSPQGNITPFDVLHIPVGDYLNNINNGKLLEFQLEQTNVYFYIDYRPYDFYDVKTSQLLAGKLLICEKFVSPL